MVQHNDGSWSHKPGSLNTRLIKGTNPSTVSWDLPTIDPYLHTYDAWGNHLSTTGAMATTLGTTNPLRYRGYIYDQEIGLYYLQSRYYNPIWGRFLNADAALGQIGNAQGCNMFAYAFNNPIAFLDSSGNWPSLSGFFGAVMVVAAAVTIVAATVATCGAALSVVGVTSGFIASTVTTAAAVATTAYTVTKAAAVATAATLVTEEVVRKTTARNNSVYVLKDEEGTVQYVGRTNNVGRRQNAHNANPARAGLEMEVIASNLNLSEARALEQAGMAYYHTINTANKMNNQINGVSPNYWGAFMEVAVGTLDYGWNQMTNEILYWVGS